MKILGIDPGTARMGWGLIETEPLRAIDSGVFETVKDSAHADRLVALYNYLVNKIRSERPEVVVVERLFFNINVQTAMAVGEGRAMVMLAAAQNKVPVVEYTALTAKLVLAGHGRADKKLMMESVRKILGLKQLHSKFDDAADGLAMALTHHFKLNGLAVPPIELPIKKKIAPRKVAPKSSSPKRKERRGNVVASERK